MGLPFSIEAKNVYCIVVNRNLTEGENLVNEEANER
jgi:hypothetical protein